MARRARKDPAAAGGARRTRAVGAVRKAWPLALEAWRRWDSLTPAQKERYRKMAAEYARRGREAINARSGGRGGGRRR
jgi:hypothetical protein